MPPIVLSMRHVSRAYDRKPVLEDLSLSFYLGAKIGIVGENGAGKSTLLRILAGQDDGHTGDATLEGDYRRVLVPQEPRLTPGRTVRQNLEEAVAPAQAALARYEEVSALMAEAEGPAMDRLMDEFQRLQERIDAGNLWDIGRQLDLASEALVLPPDDAPAETLSGGERRRVALAKALLEKPDLLLLDEPTNHLDAETVLWLEAQLREYAGTVILVTHDRYFLDHVTQWILELDGGRGWPYEGSYASWLVQKAERLRRQEKRETDRQRLLREESAWMAASPAGRLTKSRARIERYEELSAASFAPDQGEVIIQIPPGPRLGDLVLRCEGLGKGYREGEPLLEDCSFDLPKGAIAGVVGANGAGKTTLFRMITGEEKPDRGRLRLGPTVQLSYVDQHRDALDGAKTVYEEVSGGQDDILLGGQRMNARAYVSRFNFRGPQQQKLVGELSGGERNRVHLAKMLRTGGNLLLLDEPTNDLDVNTMRVLEGALAAFPNCALVISHDRMFLDRVCTHLLVFEGGGRVRWFNGNFEAYEAQVLKPAAGVRPRRSRYRTI